MKNRSKVIERIPFIMDLPGEPIPGQPLVELAGEHRVLIENHWGVTEYSCSEIRAKVKYGQLSVHGEGLRLACMTKHQLVITGRIDGITLHRGRT